MMSSKFQPNSRRNKPPPQCKKSPRPKEIHTIIGDDPLIAGLPLFLDWSITWSAGLQRHKFAASGYALPQPTGLWSLTDRITAIDFFDCGIRFNFSANTFQLLGEGKIGGIDTVPQASPVFTWDRRRPFFVPKMRLDLTLGSPLVERHWYFGVGT